MAIVLDGTTGITTPDLTDTSLTSGRVVYAGASGNLTGSTNLVFDGSSLGLGVTPSAWGSPFKAVSVNGIFNSIVGNSSYGLGIVSNAYYNAGWKYTNTGQTALYFDANENAAGTFTWRTAASGTAGNAITWTQTLAVAKGTTLALEGASTGTGIGITFPATQSASSDANTLDDYEEGTWTPTLTNCGSGTVTTGQYVKIGNLVMARVTISGGTYTANNSRYSLPFSCLTFTAGTFTIGTLRGGFLEAQNSTACYFATTDTGTAYCTVTYIVS